jgi:hypothetical protein
MKKLTPKHRRILIVGATLLAVTAVPSFAIFGLGDIVFDPSALAQMVVQHASQIEEIAKLESQLETMYKTYETLQKSYDTSLNTYNSLHATAQHFSLKTMWKPFLLAAQEEVAVESQGGESDGFTDALNKISTQAGKYAWKQGGVATNPALAQYLIAKGETPGTSAAFSQLAMVETSDAISPKCLSAVGSYNEARRQNASAQGLLTDSQFDESDDTNSEVEQLNLVNAAQAQQLAEVQAQGALHACLASQATVANMQQRNAAAHDLNTWAAVEAQRSANPVGNVSTTSTWTTYLP